MHQKSHSTLLSESETREIPPPSEPSVVHCVKGHDNDGREITAFILVPESKLQSFLSSDVINLADYHKIYTKLGHDVSEDEIKDIEDFYRKSIQLPNPIEHNFYLALCNDNLDKAKEAVRQNGGKLPLIDKGRVRPLHIAARNGCIALIPWLIEEHGCKIDDVDEFGSTPLHEAARKEKIDTMIVLKRNDYSDKDVLQIKNNEGFAPIELLEYMFTDQATKQFHLLYPNDLYSRLYLCETNLVTIFASNPMLIPILKPESLFFTTVISEILDFLLPVDWYARQAFDICAIRMLDIDRHLKFQSLNSQPTILNVLYDSVNNKKTLTSESVSQSQLDSNQLGHKNSREFMVSEFTDDDLGHRPLPQTPLPSCNHAVHSSSLSSQPNLNPGSSKPQTVPAKAAGKPHSPLSVFIPVPLSPTKDNGEHSNSSTSQILKKGKRRTLSSAHKLRDSGDCSQGELSRLPLSPRSHSEEFCTPPSPLLLHRNFATPCLATDPAIVRALSPKDPSLKIELPAVFFPLSSPRSSFPSPLRLSPRSSKEHVTSLRTKDGAQPKSRQNSYTQSSSLSAPSSPLFRGERSVEFCVSEYEHKFDFMPKPRAMSVSTPDAAHSKSAKGETHKSGLSSGVKRNSYSNTHHKPLESERPSPNSHSEPNGFKNSNGVCSELGALARSHRAKLPRPSLDGTVMSVHTNYGDWHSNYSVLANGQVTSNNSRSRVQNTMPIDRGHFLQNEGCVQNQGL